MGSEDEEYNLRIEASPADILGNWKKKKKKIGLEDGQSA